MPGFGGAVKLTGESEYKKALQQITQRLKEVSSEMKVVTSAYDKNDKSVEAANAKTEVLNKKLTEQQKALDALNAEYKRMQSAYAEENKKHEDLKKTYSDEKAKLDELGKTLGETSKEYQQQKEKVTELANDVSKSQKANEANEKSLSSLRIQINGATADINKTTKEIEGLTKAEETSGKEAEKAGDGFTVFKGVLANLASQAITSVVSGLKKLGSAFVNLGKQAIDGYSELEQLAGGVTKLFGEDAGKTVRENANKAFATAGLSANQYMDTVTSFSASLIAGLGNDTKRAAEVADIAIRDMADNANTFGTSISSIQNAYQGFAKQNFTMLDNLKLGYGGTASEMARLINESGVLGDAIEVTAQTVKDVSFADMILAINETQKRMKITGTTSKEAATTIQGSVGSMSAAWKNLVTGMADDNADFELLTQNFLNTLVNENGGGMIGNLIPRISTVIEGISNAVTTLLPALFDSIVPIIVQNLPTIITAVKNGITTILSLLPKILPTISGEIGNIAGFIVSLLPSLVSAGSQIIISLGEGIKTALPDLISMLPKVIEDVSNELILNLPMIVQTGLDIIVALIKGLIEAVPQLLKILPQIIGKLVGAILECIPMIVDAGVELLTSLVDNLPAIIEGLLEALPTLINSLLNSLTSSETLSKMMAAGVKLMTSLLSSPSDIIFGLLKQIPQIISGLVKGIVVDGVPALAKAGLDLIKGLWSGIANAATWIWDKIKGFCSGIVDGIKSFFGIHSPSTLFRDEIGENLALGIGEGFEDEMRAVSEDMKNSIPTNFDVSASVSGGLSGYESMVEAFKQALSDMKIELDDEAAGKFVERTVSRAIYA